MKKDIIPVERIARSIRYLRGEKVLLDSDLAQLYGVTTGNLNKAVNRNRDRFPSDFVFRLTTEETEHLIFQFGRSKGRGGRRHRPLRIYRTKGRDADPESFDSACLIQ